MSNTLGETHTLLDALRVEIRRQYFKPPRTPRRIVAWSGPGAAFMTKPKFTDTSAPCLRGEPQAVITPHAHAAAWLLMRLDRDFAPLLGDQLRWDFFERIGEAVVDCEAHVPAVTETAESLLLLMLREAKDILEEMEQGEFPYILSADGDEEHT